MFNLTDGEIRVLILVLFVALALGALLLGAVVWQMRELAKLREQRDAAAARADEIGWECVGLWKRARAAEAEAEHANKLLDEIPVTTRFAFRGLTPVERVRVH